MIECLCCILWMNRQKVDLTKYIEEHEFNFDNAFDSDAENQTVSHAEQFDSILILFSIYCAAILFSNISKHG